MNIYRVIGNVDINYGGIVKQVYDEPRYGENIRIEVLKEGIGPRSCVGSRWFTPMYVLKPVKPMNRRYH